MYLRLEYFGVLGVFLMMLGACSSQSQWSAVGATTAVVTANNASTSFTDSASASASPTPTATPAAPSGGGQASNPPPPPLAGSILLLSRCGDAMKVAGASIVSALSTMIDSNDNHDALELTGSSKVNGNVSIVGQARLDGTSSVSGTLKTGVAVQADPFASLPSLSTTGMTTRSSHEMSLSQDTTLSPGIYNGGIEVEAQANVKLNPGIYVIKNGEVKVGASGSLQGDGVLLYFIGSRCTSFDASGAGTVRLTGMTSGTYSGLVMVSDRDSSWDMKIENSGTVSLSGAIYLPGTDIVVSGNSSLSGLSRIVASTLDVEGSSKITLSAQ